MYTIIVIMNIAVKGIQDAIAPLGRSFKEAIYGVGSTKGKVGGVEALCLDRAAP